MPIPSTLRARPSAAIPFVFAFAALLMGPSLLGQTAAAAPAPAAARPAPQTVLDALHLAAATLQELQLPVAGGRGFEVEVEFGGRRHLLLLREHDVRAPGFQLVVHDAAGLRVVPTPPNTTFRGLVHGHAKSLVAAQLIQGQLQALVQLEPGASSWGIQPLTTAIPTADPATHVVYSGADARLPHATCGLGPTDQALPLAPAAGGRSSLSANSVCEIAIDADYRFYQLNGSNVAATQNDVTNVINGVDAIYKRDVKIEYKITQIIVRTAPIYTTNSSSALLGQFRSQWMNAHGNVPRDVAHLFTGYNLAGSTIGVAYLAGICSTSQGYGLSQSRFTSSLTSRVGLTAHELGHNWNSPHCDGQNQCNIMCSGLGGCSRSVTSFGPYAAGRISSYATSRSCLSPATPSLHLTGISPPTVQVFQGGKITLTGSGLSKVLVVNVGNQQVWLFGGISILSDSMLTFNSPVPGSFLPAIVNAQDASTTSNSLGLLYTATQPPKLGVAPTVSPGSPLLWEFGGQPSNAWFLTLAASGNTFPFQGMQWLANSFLVASGNLDGVGYGKLGINVPTSTGLGLKVFQQVVMIDTVKGQITGTTNVADTTTK